MKILLIGGTRFLGKHLVDAALKAGHQVTLFNRGISNLELFPEVERLVGDRSTGDLDSLRGRSWDAAIDVPTNDPCWAGEMAAALDGTVSHVTFISSISVYAELQKLGLDEHEQLLCCKDTDVNLPQHYGARKARCEKAYAREFNGELLIVRPGLIVGPDDPTDRFTYWPQRLAKGGRFLAPGDGNSLTQFIDVRDLSEWVIRQVEKQKTGCFNATGPEKTLTFARLLDEILSALGVNSAPLWFSEAQMKESGISPWVDMPCYVYSDIRGMLEVSNERALASGLTYRPLAQTIRDTYEWDLRREVPGSRKAGLDVEREEQIIKNLGYGVAKKYRSF